MTERNTEEKENKENIENVEQKQEKQEQKVNPKLRFKRRVLEVRGLVIDYRNPEVLQKFITKTGKIIPRRLTGASAKLQRKISKEIKKARMANLLPFTKR